LGSAAKKKHCANTPPKKNKKNTPAQILKKMTPRAKKFFFKKENLCCPCFLRVARKRKKTF
jgi:hypothetical protein